MPLRFLPKFKTIFPTKKIKLFTFVISGAVKIMEILLKSGADVNSADNIESTPLMKAIAFGN